MYALWTEHRHADGGEGTALIDDPPESAEITELKVGHVLVGCLETPSCFVLRGVYATADDAMNDLESMHEKGWETWLCLWKTGQKLFEEALAKIDQEKK